MGAERKGERERGWYSWREEWGDGNKKGGMDEKRERGKEAKEEKEESWESERNRRVEYTFK